MYGYMKAIIAFLALLLSICASHGFCQGHYTDSLKKELVKASPDTQKIKLLGLLGKAYNFANADTSLMYTSEGLRLAENIDDPFLIAKMQSQMCATLSVKGNYPLALNYGLHALSFFEQSGDSVNMAKSMGNLQLLYKEMGDYERVLKNERETGEWRSRLLNDKHSFAIYAYAFDKAKQPDSVIYYLNKSMRVEIPNSGLTILLANAFNIKNIKDSALFYYRRTIDEATDAGLSKDIIESYNGMAELYQKSGQYDSAKFYLISSVNENNAESYPLGKLKAYEIFSNIYDREKNSDSALYYLKKSNLIREQLFSTEKQNTINNLFFTRDEQLKELEKAKKDYNDRLKQNLLLSGLFVFVIAAGFLIWNIRQKQRSLVLIGNEKKEVEAQKIIAENALEKLVITQRQLVQSEKLASLGELAAGIAHEIQNPLNFVNNFSDLNQDLIAELNEEVDRGNNKEVKIIAENIKENEAKINLHGRRADAIVKGMLQHSQVSTGQKEPVDINALCDEYLRLSYAGFMAKDKNFNAVIEKDFDMTLSKINIIPQDIGRVLLNLINNAFYAVSEKSKLSIEGYEPMVSVLTKKINGEVEISVADNGNGIPDKLLDKVFQPFFTTKPTGQGTGLGLSLSYDIIKSHQGKIDIRNTPGESAEFIITLPINA